MDDLTTQEQPESLRDTLSNALEATETPVETTETPVETSESSRSRDEHGRFAKKAETAPDTPVEIQPEVPPQIKPRPSSWKKDYEEHWGKLDPNLQEYIHQREADYAKGVSTYKSQWDTAAPLVEAIGQFRPLLDQHGIEPTQWITNLGNAHAKLALGSPEEKLQMFAQLATDYGVPLQGLVNGQIDPQFSHIASTVTQLQQKLEQQERIREQQEQAQLASEISKFSEGKPYFEQVKDTMAQLLGSGVASDLQSAYDKAIRLHDDIFQQHQAEQLKAQEEDRQRKIAEAKAKAVSPKSAAPTAQKASGKGTGLRDLIASQLDEVSSGHI